ncbi:MAG: hypothetical protein H6976_07960 [Gammaproteobacteria bacterium]|nr:hypothetical protein [Gammaproteobacteria bacterium]
MRREVAQSRTASAATAAETAASQVEATRAAEAARAEAARAETARRKAQAEAARRVAQAEAARVEAARAEAARRKAQAESRLPKLELVSVPRTSAMPRASSPAPARSSGGKIVGQYAIQENAVVLRDQYRSRNIRAEVERTTANQRTMYMVRIWP